MWSLDRSLLPFFRSFSNFLTASEPRFFFPALVFKPLFLF